MSSNPLKKLTRREKFDIVRNLFDGRYATVDGVPSRMIETPRDDSFEYDISWEDLDEEAHIAGIITEVDKHFERYVEGKGIELPELSKDFIKDLVSEAIYNTRIDTYLEYIKSLKWDGIDRRSTFGEVIGLYLPGEVVNRVGSINAAKYVSAMGSMLILGPVERHLKPFTQEKIPIIISSSQGTGKGTTIRALAMAEKTYKYFYEVKQLNEENAGRDMVLSAYGKAFVEWAEIDHILNHVTDGFLKAFFDEEGTHVRSLYKRREKRITWTAFNVGTTNEEKVLPDPTGNRRFPAIHMRKQTDTPNRDITDTKSPLYLPNHPDYRDQLLAQAYFEISEGLSYTDEISEIFEEVQKEMENRSMMDNICIPVLVKYLYDEYTRWVFDLGIQKTDEMEFRIAWNKLNEDFTSHAKQRGYDFKTIQHALKDFQRKAKNSERFGFEFKSSIRIDGERVQGLRLFDIEALKDNL